MKFTSLAAIYAAAVLDGERTLDSISPVIRPQVETILGVSAGADAGNVSAQQ
ncbi:hypothetical protein [Lacticaseibacillus absianus]|uniref:hypothetical protein n=1 Tax=Lacticaseibacillus absianus TaxID=2729623 RepID=UPI0015C95C1B|nr:hypothetical protein [Lacticaseibacillus absianus]